MMAITTKSSMSANPARVVVRCVRLIGHVDGLVALEEGNKAS
jgi:hypothetical protein